MHRRKPQRLLSSSEVSDSAASSPRAQAARAATLLDAHYARGRMQYGQLQYPFDPFRARATAKTRAWCQNESQPWLRAVEQLKGADFYLASACDAGRDPAWERLRDAFLGRLTGLALRRGVRKDDAVEWIDETLADLSLPRPEGLDERRIGAYSGRGPLFSFLATLVLRRRADAIDAAQRTRRREARRVRGAADQVDTTHVLERAMGGELADVTRRALREALAALTPREHLVLVLKHRDGHSQREIARVLGVGAPRVSRLVDAGHRKVAVLLRERLGDIDTPEGWQSACEAVRRELLEQVPERS